jgi:hypothetical protein
LERCTIRTVVPAGGNVTPALLLGWAAAVCCGAELECVALAFAVDVGDDADEDEADSVLDDEAVLWVAVAEAAPVVDVEPDDPPHAVSSSTSEPSPVATVHPLLRITSLLTGGTRVPGSLRVLPGLTCRR